MTPGDKTDATAPGVEKPEVLLRDRWVRLLDGDGAAGKVLTGALIAVLAVGSGFLLLPPRKHAVVSYGEKDLGSFANGVVKADRTGDIPDVGTTERHRQEARDAVKAVYDLDTTAADQAVKRVQEAFELMQRAYGDYRLDLAKAQAAPAAPAAGAAGGAAAKAGSAKAPAPKAGASKGHRAKAHAAAKPPSPKAAAKDAAAAPEAVPKEDRKAVDHLLVSHKADFLQLLQVVVDDAEFEALVRERFDPSIENAVGTLVRHAMARPIIADKKLLGPSQKRGIVIRPLPSRDAHDERTVTDPGKAIIDLATARAGILEDLPKVLPKARPEVRLIAGRLARRLVGVNLTFNSEATKKRQDQAAASVKPSVFHIERGEKIIGDGERIERRHLIIFDWMRKQDASIYSVETYLGAGLVALILVLSLFAFARGGVWRFRPSRKDLIFLLVMLLGSLAAARVGLFVANVVGDRFTGVAEATFYYALPISAAVVLVRLVLAGEITLVFAAVLAIFSGVLTDGSLGFALFVFVGGVVGADVVGRARDRGGIWRAGMLMAVVNVLVVVALMLKQGGFKLPELGAGAACAVFAGAVSPLIVLGLTFVVEKVFGYTTDLTLLELANLNNPLLKELVVQAPGTYHHSMMLGSMVEAAAEAIGGNPLLARVGAYYHDIGKGKAPLYFAENQKGENPHDKLAPSMSALIIRRHVTDGIKMGKAARLPPLIVDMVPMHHGTRLMAYFWHKAKEEAERKGEPPPSETEYRHGGPKPRFREAALLMIADSVEAASRTIAEPNADRFRGVVQKVINNCFADGQFDECDITLKDLHAVTRSFVRTLEAVYHSRPEYQQPADKSADKAEKVQAKAKAKEGDAEAAAPAKAGEKAAKGGEKAAKQGEKAGEKPAKGGEKAAAPAAKNGTKPAPGADAKPAAAGNGQAAAGAEGEAPAEAEAAQAAAPADEAATETATTEPLEEGETEGEALKRLGTN